MARVSLFVCRADNYGCLVHDPATGATAAIDVPEAAPVLAALSRTGWRLSDILVTHHHGDHVDGIPALKAQTGARVTAHAQDQHRIPLVDRAIEAGQMLALGGCPFEVIDTPGHTVGHVSFHFPEDRLLFAGDTLFSLGCGRLFEGTPAQMWASLTRLASLPEDTEVYCGHEYTASNARFALSVDPDNPALRSRAREVETLRMQAEPTLPTTIGIERATNPFLRASDPAIARHIGLEGADPVEVFARLREMKNRA